MNTNKPQEESTPEAEGRSASSSVVRSLNQVQSKYNKGELLEFKIYGYTVKGEFLNETDETITIKTTHDHIKCLIGTEQEIHKTHLQLVSQV